MFCEIRLFLNLHHPQANTKNNNIETYSNIRTYQCGQQPAFGKKWFHFRCEVGRKRFAHDHPQIRLHSSLPIPGLNASLKSCQSIQSTSQAPSPSLCKRLHASIASNLPVFVCRN